MRLFRPLYEKAIEWAAKPRADIGLALLSFVEAFIFPVAPEIMLAPMTLARPRKWWQFWKCIRNCTETARAAGWLRPAGR